jgi:nicotinamide phosphoribosyltransferase
MRILYKNNKITQRRYKLDYKYPDYNLENLILDTDSYKVSHYLQYPENTTGMMSYIESRGGDMPNTLFFGLQAYIKDHLLKPITQANIDEAEELYAYHLEGVDFNNIPQENIISEKEVVIPAHRIYSNYGSYDGDLVPERTVIKRKINFDGLRKTKIFNKEGWQYILEKYNGYMPVTIKAIQEGVLIPTKNCLVTIECADPDAFWVVSYLETSLLRSVWYTTSVATVSWTCKQIISKYLDLTCDNPNAEIMFKLHDFGGRGVSSRESAMLGGMAHLVNFMGTDTISALIGANNYYGSKMAGFSIPASEHSTMTARGKDGEPLAMKQMLDVFAKPGALVACVSDSYDIFYAVEHIWGEQLRQQIIDSGAVLVVRPDSGSPVDVPVECVEKLAEKFGYTVNKKGFKVLKYVRVIQGDGTCPEMIEAVLQKLYDLGFSAENIAFGMGGALLQKVDRDTQRWAMKCCAMLIDGKWIDIFKKPITDPGKDSKKGRLTVLRHKETGKYLTETENMAKLLIERLDFEPAMFTIYENGKLMKEWTFDEVRAKSLDLKGIAV